MGREGCPSGEEVLLPLQQLGALHLQLPAGESLQGEYAVKLQGGDGIEEGSLDPSDEKDNVQEPQGGGFQGITQPKQTPFLNLDHFQHWYGVKKTTGNMTWLLTSKGNTCIWWRE